MPSVDNATPAPAHAPATEPVVNGDALAPSTAEAAPVVDAEHPAAQQEPGPADDQSNEAKNETSEAADSAENGTKEIGTLEDAQKLFEEGRDALKSNDYDHAAESFSRCLEIRAHHYGELSIECAFTYYKYGCALLYKAQSESDPIGEVKETNGTDEADEEEQDKKEEQEGQEAPEAQEEDLEDEEEESDLDMAWKMLDIARIIYEKQESRSIEEVDVITALADVSLEREDFEMCFKDYTRALQIMEQLVEPDDRGIAELCFKLGLAHQLGYKPKEALKYCQQAVTVCEARLKRLKSEVDGNSTIPMKGKKHVVVSDNNDEKKLVEEIKEPASNAEIEPKDASAATESAPKEVMPSTDSEIKESTPSKVPAPADEEETKPMPENGTELKAENGTDSKAENESEEPESPASKKQREIKEIEQLLEDLKEKVVELEGMATGPSLLESLKESNPEAVNSIKQVFSATAQLASLANNGEGSASGGDAENGGGFDAPTISTTTAPVTHLGVVGRGVKRATPVTVSSPTSGEPCAKKRSLDEMMTKGGTGETQIGFGSTA